MDALAEVEGLIEQGALEEARARLAGLQGGDDVVVVKLRLALAEESLPPDLVMQRLTQLLRKNPDTRGARALYQRASELSFEVGRSNPSHSHLPPPVKDD